MEIPLCKIYTDDREVQAVKEVLDSGWLAHGPKNKEFEKLFIDEIGTKHATCFNSCASALYGVIVALGLKGEIILPSFTFSASANVIELAGCTPVFAEIDPVTMNLDPEDLSTRITDKTVAIMPVHYAGQVCEMDKIMAIANKHNLRVIEDSAETLGASLNGKVAGSFDIGCFSFYPTKNLTTGEGGMVTHNDDDLISNLNAGKAHGITRPTFVRDKEAKPYHRDAIIPGHNFRMSDINAAIGVVQMRKLSEMNRLRREHSQYLNEGLKDLVRVPIVKDLDTHVYQMYVIQVEEIDDRDALLDLLKSSGIGASVHFDPPVHMQSYYSKKYPITLPVTEDVCQRIITLPMFPSLKKEELDYIIEKIGEYFAKKK